MKIATWNVERLNHRRYLDEITDICNNIQADILVLTENDDSIKPEMKYCCHTPTPPPLKFKGYDTLDEYKQSEHRVSIYSNYKIIDKKETFNKYTALCLELETEKGNILVYGTIMGIAARRLPYKEDVKEQLNDFYKFTDAGYNLCICGDYNCSFSDDSEYCLSKECRQRIRDTFSKCNIKLVTENQAECVDYIAISDKFLGECTPEIEEWNSDKRLSDHKGISVQFD